MKETLKKYLLPLILAVLGVGLMVIASTARSMDSDTDTIARRAERKIERRIKQLDAFAEQMLAADNSEWTKIEKLPDDMVLYRYVCDTLQCWNNQLPILNDNARTNIRYQWLCRPELTVNSPLNDIGSELSYINLGSRWYLAKWYNKGELTEVLGAFEVCVSYVEGETEVVNPRTGIPADYIIYPITGNTGATVEYQGKPLFNIVTSGSWQGNNIAYTLLRWLALIFFALAALFFVYRNKSWKGFSASVLTLILCYAAGMVWGSQIPGNDPGLFSPALYAGSGPWPSFGALLLLNFLIFSLSVCIFAMRDRLFESEKKKTRTAVCIGLGALIVGILVYTALSVIDLTRNSNISLELTLFMRGIPRTLLALFAYGFLLCSLTLLLYMLLRCFDLARHRSRRIINIGMISVCALLYSFLLFGISSQMGFYKERSRVGVWANRLSVDRNLSLELQIRSVENEIAADNFIPVFADMDEAGGLIAKEVQDLYFANISGDYDIVVSVCSRGDENCNALFNAKFAGGTPIGPGSHFVCRYDNNGRSSYAGNFYFISQKGAGIRMVVEIVSRVSKEDNGYYSIFNRGGNPGEVVMPEYYSHAKYLHNDLASYKGTVAYPTVLSEPYSSKLEEGADFFRDDGHLHFLRKISEDEVIIISRRVRGSLAVATSILSIFAIMFLLLTPLLKLDRPREKEKKGNFRRKIRLTIAITVSLALVIVASVSLRFVFERTKMDSSNVMTGKASAIQALMESRCQNVDNLNQVNKSELMTLLQAVASTTRSDLSLFTPKGSVYLSTVADMYEMAILDFRMDGDVYDAIMNKHQRLYVHEEKAAGRRYYALYAPILNSRGQTLAIICTPVNRNSDLARDAIPHAILLLILLVAIIILTSNVTGSIVNKIFAPLSQITGVMGAAGTKGLEKIEYKGDDEISTLVDAYNRMVEVIDESSKAMAQSERDKAWSSMARQVAHEIKNPLTPMSLEINKLVLMKQRNHPKFAEQFDVSARVILEQIDILTDTANEFSTFAKLYSEEPVMIDLNQLLEDQIMLFSNKENIEITYLGFKDATLMGPKPQLTRVFVNLLTNACQSIENARGSGKIRVELRNAKESYDISVEDDGPGVPEENIEKLFTPNFTTKSSGTGLGLAICRNIVEKCNGSIGYKRSFNLGGACFTVKLPKDQTNA